MKVQTEMAQVELVKTAQHDVQRRAFLRHEQDRLAARRKLRDQVRDRLALTGARRTADNTALTSNGRGDGLLLRRVGIAHKELLVGQDAVEFTRIRVHSRSACKFGGGLVACDACDDVVLRKLLQKLLQIFDDRELLETEVSQDPPRLHPKAGHAAGLPREALEHRPEIELLAFVIP